MSYSLKNIRIIRFIPLPSYPNTHFYNVKKKYNKIVFQWLIFLVGVHIFFIIVHVTIIIIIIIIIPLTTYPLLLFLFSFLVCVLRSPLPLLSSPHKQYLVYPKTEWNITITFSFALFTGAHDHFSTF